MTDDVFRIVVAAGVVLAAVAFVVQAGIMWALFQVAKKTQENAARLTARAEPLMDKIEPVLVKSADVIERAGPVVDRMGPVIARIGPTIDKIGPILDRAVPAVEKIGPVLTEARATIVKAGAFVERATEIVASANMVVQDARPQVTELSKEALEITRLGREQVERIGDLVHDAGDKARNRLNQIDETVDNTIEKVEQVSGAMKRAVLKPVREVNGLAAGISAAVSTLVRGQRRSSVDAATQDEEMFI